MVDVLYFYTETEDSKKYPLLNGVEPSKNLINIDGVDYYMGPLNPAIEGNKGGNSYVYKLYPMTDYENGIEEPACIIKISKNKESYSLKDHKPRTELRQNQRFLLYKSAKKSIYWMLLKYLIPAISL